MVERRAKKGLEEWFITEDIKASILKETNPEYSLEKRMGKLKLQYFGHLMQIAIFTEKDPDSGKD